MGLLTGLSLRTYNVSEGWSLDAMAGIELLRKFERDANRSMRVLTKKKVECHSNRKSNFQIGKSAVMIRWIPSPANCACVSLSLAYCSPPTVLLSKSVVG